MFGEVLFRIHHRRALLQSCVRLNKVTSGERGWRRIIVYAPPPSHFNIDVGKGMFMSRISNILQSLPSPSPHTQSCRLTRYKVQFHVRFFSLPLII